MNAHATSSPIVPQQRSATLDTIRGLAVLGILVMNAQLFALPISIANFPSEFGGLSFWDRASWHVQSALFDGRMRGLFSMLFGAGLWLQWQKAERDGYADRFGDLWSRRCVWLTAFGMLHGYLLQWPGDILFTYGICGLFLFPFRKLPAWGQIGFALLVILVATGIGSAQGVGMLEDSQEVRAALDAQQAGDTLDEEQQAALERYEQSNARRSAEALEAEAREVREGDWIDSFLSCAEVTAKIESVFLYKSLFWDAFGFMLLGLALGRWGFFQGRGPAWVYLLVLGIGYGVAVPWTLVLSTTWDASEFSMMELEPVVGLNFTFQPTRLAVGLAHASLVVLMLRSALLAKLLRPLAAVGRTAFSNYILQTVLCTAVFYGWGLGWFGTLQRAELMLFCLGVWVVALVWSPLWLRAFRFGPLEWVWRTLVHLRRPRRTTDGT